MFSNMFGNIEKKTGVKMEEVLKLAKSLRNADFQDEKTVREVIKKVGALANKPVSKQKEDMLVKTIINGKVPKDFSSLEKMLKKKKK
ncbi:stage VI sporulation protein F [Halobacillus mangrovi]|uniref:Stage VI sporulation protein F n=1 Tax=Halobacillus mangrovi TaxID=402384 RepID=A0A1W5ZVV9_9BACI|nr:stage VI sporulation protein F [Halobacillus mangrovi]ARI77381.1 stage VI sporulation protein F [Halobacillus mangrovi]